MYKVIWMCRFKQGLDPEVAKRHWHDVHGQLMLKVPGLLGYVQNHRTGEIGGLQNGDPSRSFDGYSVAWFESREMYETARHSPEWAAISADSANVFDKSTMLEAELTEHVMRQVPRS
jgi:uncharacterized protein (TIGR02118 family)